MKQLTADMFSEEIQKRYFSEEDVPSSNTDTDAGNGDTLPINPSDTKLPLLPFNPTSIPETPVWLKNTSRVKDQQKPGTKVNTSIEPPVEGEITRATGEKAITFGDAIQSIQNERNLIPGTIKNLRDGLITKDDVIGDSNLFSAAYLRGSGFRGDLQWKEENPEAALADLENKLLNLNSIQMGIVQAWAGGLDFVQDNAENVAEWTQNNYPSIFKFFTERDPEGVGRSTVRAATDVFEVSDFIAAMFPPISTTAATIKKGLQQARVVERAQSGTARSAREAAIEVSRIADENAVRVASENLDVKNAAIRQFEKEYSDKIGRPVTISIEDKKGNLEIDMEKIKELGKELGDQHVLGGYSTPEAQLMQHTIIPSNLDGVVAMFATIKKSGKLNEFFDDKKSVIENLTDIIIHKQDKLSQVQKDELVQTAVDFNVDVKDIVVIGLGSSSEAGKLLQKLSAIKRMGATKTKEEIKDANLESSGPELMDYLRRVENLRRGTVVSMVKTASRNFISGLERTPFEVAANYLQYIMWTVENKGMVKGARSVFSPTNIKTAMLPVKRMLSDPAHSREYVELLLDNPEYRKYWQQLTEQLGEIRSAQGAGATKDVSWLSRRAPEKLLDNILLEAEGVVDFLNVPNRLQEQIVRQGFVLAEMERLIKMEWNVDLLPSLHEGKLAKFINNSSDLRPEGARSFEEIVGDSVRKGMDVTYAGRPDWKLAGQVVDGLTRSVIGTMAINMFPRFVANGIETVFQYTAGSLVPIYKIGAMKAKKIPVAFTSRDREYISRNIVGAGVIYGAVQYYDSDDAPDDFTRISVGNKEIETTPFFPTQQISWIANAIRHWRDGTLKDWKGSSPKLIKETFFGSGPRHIQGREMFPVIAFFEEALKEDGEAITGYNFTKRVGRAISDYLATWTVQGQQAADLLRGIGIRGNARANKAVEERVGESAFSQIGKEISRRLPTNRNADDSIFFTSLDDDMDNDDVPTIRQTLKDPELVDQIKKGKVVVTPWYGASKYMDPMLNAVLGITTRPGTKRKRLDGTYVESVAEFFTRYGYEEYETGSKLYNAPLAKFRQNLLLAKHYPSYVEGLREREKYLSDAWDNNGTIKGSDDRTIRLTEKVKKGYQIKPLSGIGISTVTSTGKTKFIQDQMSSLIKTTIALARKKFNKKDVSEWYAGTSKEQTEIGEYVSLHLQYRKIGSKLRRAAQSSYIGMNDGKHPDLTKAGVIAELIDIAKSYKKRLPK